MTHYKTLNPHPKVLELYKKVGYFPERIAGPEVEEKMLNAMGQAKVEKVKDPMSDPKNPRVMDFVLETKEVDERPIKRQIVKFYRVKNGEKEHVYYVEMLEGQAFSGKILNHTRIVGKYGMPVFQKDINRETGSTTITGIHRIDQEYDIPYGVKSFTDPSTGEETSLEQLGKLRTSQTKYYVKTQDRSFGLRNISFEDFTTKSFEDLVHYGDKGTWPATPKPEEKAKSK